MGQDKVQERTEAAEFPVPIRNRTKTDKRITFSRRAAMLALGRRETGEIIYVVNVALAFRKVLTHARLQRLFYNKKGNLSGLIGVAVTTKMIVPIVMDAVMKAASASYHTLTSLVLASCSRAVLLNTLNLS